LRQQAELRNALDKAEECRWERDAVLEIRSRIYAAGAQTFGPYFADRVMAHLSLINETAALVDEWLQSLLKAFRVAACAAAIIGALLLPFNMYTSDFSILHITSVDTMAEQAGILFLEGLL